MTIKDLILRALEYEPLSENMAQRVLLRILNFMQRGAPMELPEPKGDTP